jgi:SAM-dependent methyltransferase
MMDDVDYGAIADSIVPYLEKDSVILDAGCGSGRLALELLERGHHVIGIDNDPGMLALAEERIRESGFHADLYDHDLRHPVHVTVDIVLLMFDVLNHFKGIKGVLSNIDKALDKGGLIIFDVYREDVPGLFDAYVEEDSSPVPYRWEIRRHNMTLRHVVRTEDTETVIVQTVRPLEEDLKVLSGMGYRTERFNGPDPRKHYIVATKT